MLVEDSSDTQSRGQRGALRVGADMLLLATLGVIVLISLVIAVLFKSPSSEDVVEAFRMAGLEVGEAYPIEKAEGPSPGISSKLPGTYEEGMRFEISSLGKDSADRELGGRVFVFESEKDLAEVHGFYEDLAETGFFFTWVFVEGHVLVQINGELPEQEAERYEMILKEVV